MADLSELDASLSTKLVGATPTGTETGYVSSTANGELVTTDIMDTSAVQAVLSVSTTAVAARVGGSNLSERKMLVIQCQTSGITYGFSSGSQPFNLPNGTTVTLSLGPNVTIWLRKASGTGSVVVAELS